MFLLLVLLTSTSAVTALEAQSASHPGIARAVAAYEAGDFPRALTLIDSLPLSLPARDQAIRYLYRGLIQFAFGEPALARAAFARAVQVEPSVRLDPAVHAPSRITAYLEVLDSVASVWRAEADAAERAGNLEDARRGWNRAAAAIPSDTVAQRRLADVERRQAGIRASTPANATAPDSGGSRLADPAAGETNGAAAPRQYSAGRAAVLGMVVPGLGQIYAGKTGRGLLVFAGAAAAVATGMLYEVVDIECLTIPVDNTCPPGDVVSERSERPYLIPGVVAAAALALIGAIDGAVAARSANRSAESGGRESTSGAGPRIGMPAIEPGPYNVRIALLRVVF